MLSRIFYDIGLASTLDSYPIWYRVPELSLDYGLVSLTDDRDIRVLHFHVCGNHEIELFLESVDDWSDTSDYLFHLRRFVQMPELSQCVVCGDRSCYHVLKASTDSDSTSSNTSSDNSDEDLMPDARS